MPIETTQTPQTVLQSDFPNLVESTPDGVEIQWTRDSDGKLRGYVAAEGGPIEALGGVASVDGETGLPVRTIDTTTLTDIFATTILADTIAANRKVRVQLRGDLKQNDTAQGLNIAIDLGAATVWGAQSSGAIAQSSTRRPWRLDLDISYGGSSAQSIDFEFRLGSATTSGSGVGQFFALEQSGLGHAEASQDNTADLDFAVQMAWVDSATDADIRLFSGHMEVVT